MFSEEKRCYYQKSPLAEVICQLRFPRILTINANPPADFQEQIRSQFPQYSASTENPMQVSTGEAQTKIINYRFSSHDGLWHVNLTQDTISLSTQKYTGWEHFAERLDRPLAAFIQQYKPAYFERIGLRYINFFSRSKLGLEDVPFRDLFAPEYLGLLHKETLPESAFNRSTMDADVDIGNSCRLQFHAGPGLVNIQGQPSKEVHFILDCDYYMKERLPVNYSAGALQTLHGKAFPVFRGAITDLMHNAMDPTDI